MLVLIVFTRTCLMGQGSRAATVDSLLKISHSRYVSAPDSSLSFAFKARDIAVELKDSSRLTESYMQISASYNVKNEFIKAYEHIILAKEVAKKINDDDLLARSLIEMGHLNFTVGRQLPAIKSYQRAISISQRRKDFEKVARCFTAIGITYYDLESMDSVKKYMHEAVRVASQVSNKLLNRTLLSSLLYEVIAKDFKTVDEILPTLTTTLITPADEANYYWLLAESEYNAKEYKAAETHAKLSIAGFNNMSDRRMILIKGYLTLEKILYAQGRYKENYDLTEKYDSIYYSLEQESKTRQVELYEIEEKEIENQLAENQIKLLRQKNELQKLKLQEKNFTVISVVLSALLTFSISYIGYARFKARKEHQLLEKNLEATEKEEELKERQISIADSEKQVEELQLTAVRAHMSPQFIFHTLNSIQMQIKDNSELGALRNLSRFARLLRMTLEKCDSPIITLASELEALKIYLEIETLRLKDLKYEIDADPALLAEQLDVPSLLLRPIVEDYIKQDTFEQKPKSISVVIKKSETKIIYIVRGDFNQYLDKQLAFPGVELVKQKLKALYSPSGFVVEIKENPENVTQAMITIEFPFLY